MAAGAWAEGSYSHANLAPTHPHPAMAPPAHLLCSVGDHFIRPKARTNSAIAADTLAITCRAELFLPNSNLTAQGQAAAIRDTSSCCLSGGLGTCSGEKDAGLRPDELYRAFCRWFSTATSRIAGAVQAACRLEQRPGCSHPGRPC